MTSARATRRALTRKARRAEIRCQVRAALAEVAREERAAAAPGELIDVRLGWRGPGCPCGACDVAGEPRPGWLEELTPEQRWRHDQATAWECALWERTVWAPERAAEARRWLLALLALRARAARRAAGLEAITRSAPARDTGPPGALAEVLTCHPRTGPPAAGRCRELASALGPSGP